MSSIFKNQKQKKKDRQIKMNDNELALRMKFYLAPKDTSYEKLMEMNEKYTNYPGLTLDQAKEASLKIMELKNNATYK